MLSQLTRCAKNLWSRLSSAANKLFRCLTEPAHPNLVTGTLADLPRRRLQLLAENALLRQQLIVLRRNTKTPRLTWRERLSLVILAHWVPNWKQVLQIIQPDTLVRWHREGFRLFWRLKSRRPLQTQPQRLAAETIALIQRMARDASQSVMGGGTDSGRVVEVEHPGGQADHPKVHPGSALETAGRASLVQLPEDARAGHLGV
jgi:hypothetical protein